MTSRSQEDPRDLSLQRDEIDACDAFLDEIAAGAEPSGGTDPLSVALAGLREEAVRDGEADDLAGIFAALDSAESGHGEPAQTKEPSVASIAEHRQRRRGFQRPRLMSVVGGAALGAVAASAMIVVGGTAVYNAEPGGPLWGARIAVFGEPRADMVQLASTLEEADELREKGDVEGAKRLIAQARELINYLDERDRDVAHRQVEEAQRTVTMTPDVPKPSTRTSTVTATTTQPNPSSSSRSPKVSTTTETTTATETVTETVTESQDYGGGNRPPRPTREPEADDSPLAPRERSIDVDDKEPKEKKDKSMMDRIVDDAPIELPDSVRDKF
ncbi:hypothetical protein CCICO_01950 [Corynebacterium ciconiae DSM 44920]|uniref:hypothetical protein n=1 Tax=Corynebacterium ciconiae TaxID=227319 RepID=UPI00037EE8CC|nr:hypothetical protein [Corynebacterium ciconiae]WKD60442.1 hypothetical protein CCICO_01950 [Corynebacterium ciconiae DSM 44920]